MDLILRAPSRYSHVQTNTTAKLKKMKIHMMPSSSLARYLETGKIVHTKVAPDILGKHVEARSECITGSVLTIPAIPVWLILHVSA